MISQKLYYKHTTNWMPLPDWGCFFLELGIALSTYENTRKRVVVGAALPTRAFAASLIAVGVTTSKFVSPNQDIEANKRFQELCRLKQGTQLIYHKNGDLIKVFCDGPEVIQGEIKLRLTTKGGRGGRYWITSKQALQVGFPAKAFSGPLLRPSRRVNTQQSEFVESLLDTKTVATLATQSSLDTLIIGPLNCLKEEIQNYPFAAKSAFGFVPGVLQDIVRVRRFSKSGETYRSDVNHVHSNADGKLGQEIPTVVVFDGAASFLKWRHSWYQSHWVALFDQTEPEFDVAIQVFNGEYTTIPVGDRELTHFPLSPTYIPIATYQETRS